MALMRQDLKCVNHGDTVMNGTKCCGGRVIIETSDEARLGALGAVHHINSALSDAAFGPDFEHDRQWFPCQQCADARRVFLGKDRNGSDVGCDGVMDDIALLCEECIKRLVAFADHEEIGLAHRLHLRFGCGDILDSDGALGGCGADALATACAAPKEPWACLRIFGGGPCAIDNIIDLLDARESHAGKISASSHMALSNRGPSELRMTMFAPYTPLS